LSVGCSGPGQSILLAVGGANESLLSTPKTYDLVLKRRKGFVRIALRTGAAIVPCIAFGETNLYPTFKGETSVAFRAVQGCVPCVRRGIGL
jgi:2-acylglycerol O-acyltransferase 2